MTTATKNKTNKNKNKTNTNTNTNTKKNTAFNRPVNVSETLSRVVGSGPMPRTEVTKRVWDYIKKNNRQDPKNKRNIVPDATLAQVFGSSQPIDMFKMTGIISKHLSENTRSS
ncbi:hypothetical protein JYU14_01430 [Simkania negevensis]|uniref:DM2 domain-containing protein n=1 Tax=Simkania negevensis TaxID=83561 RepID=A0ABS3AUS1_9BACT|nr:hypothetical protein [Simkania negevensis]